MPEPGQTNCGGMAERQNARQGRRWILERAGSGWCWVERSCEDQWILTRQPQQQQSLTNLTHIGCNKFMKKTAIFGPLIVAEKSFQICQVSTIKRWQIPPRWNLPSGLEQFRTVPPITSSRTTFRTCTTTLRSESKTWNHNLLKL